MFELTLGLHMHPMFSHQSKLLLPFVPAPMSGGMAKGVYRNEE